MGAEQKRTVTLKYPLQSKDGKTVDTLKFGRMKAKQLRLIPQSFQKMYQQIQELSEELGLKEGEKLPPAKVQQIAVDCEANMLDLLPVVASMAGITEEMADDLDAEEDLPAVLETAMDFLSGKSGPSEVQKKGGVTVSMG